MRTINLHIACLLTLCVLTVACARVDADNSLPRSEMYLPDTGYKPNILFILTEDIGCYLPMYGDSSAKTPNLNRIASESLIFTNAYTVSGVCAPSRSSIITGMYPVSIGSQHMRTHMHKKVLPVKDYSVVPPPEVKCFTELLRAAGYYCSNKGKKDFQFEVPYSAFNDLGLEGGLWEGREPGQPFFTWYNIFVTHESQIWERENDSMRIDPASVTVLPYYPDTDTIRMDIARMYSNIELMDIQVGELIDKLKDARLYDSTIIVFASDHGGPLPRQKREIMAAGLHVPFIVRFPNGKYKGEINDIIQFIDIAPTFLSLASVEPPGYLQGNAFLGPHAKPSNNIVYAARDRMDMQYDRCRSLFDGRFFYIKNYYPDLPWYQDIEFRKRMPSMQQLINYHEAGKLDSVQNIWFQTQKPAEQLFDLHQDPFEIRNLSELPEYEKIILRNRELLAELQSKYGDLGSMTEYELVNKMWPGFVQPETDMVQFETDRSGAITLSCPTQGASVIYQVKKPGELPDPSEPNEWKLYAVPIKMEPNEIVYSIAFRIGYKPSKICNYILNQSNL